MLVKPIYRIFGTHDDFVSYITTLDSNVRRQWSRYNEGIFRPTPQEELGDTLVLGVQNIGGSRNRSSKGGFAEVDQFRLSVSTAVIDGNHAHFFDTLTRTPRFLNGPEGPQLSEASYTFNHAYIDTSQFSGPLLGRTTCAKGQWVGFSAPVKRYQLDQLNAR